MSQTSARIWWDASVGQGAYRMTVPYNQTFNETFKLLIPHSDRSWSPDSKVWTITERFFEPTRKLVAQTFGNVVVITKAQAEKASQPAPIKLAPLDSVLLQFVRLLPFEAAQKAYRTAAMMLHPDHGGDMDKMANLNACWQRLEEEFYRVKN